MISKPSRGFKLSAISSSRAESFLSIQALAAHNQDFYPGLLGQNLGTIPAWCLYRDPLCLTTCTIHFHPGLPIWNLRVSLFGYIRLDTWLGSAGIVGLPILPRKSVSIKAFCSQASGSHSKLLYLSEKLLILLEHRLLSVLTLSPLEGVMPAGKSEKREYKSDDVVKGQHKQFEKRGFKVNKRKNLVYIKRGK